MCEPSIMEAPLKTSELATAADISMSYASEILNNKRAPSRALAIGIFRKTGRKFGPIAHLSDDDIETLERIEGLV